MFQTRIASDAVAHQAGLGAAWVFAPTPPGCLWFATLAQLQSCVPADFQARVRASFLMLDYQADEISAAAVLIADDRALLQRLLIDERVRKRAEAISATDEVSVLARSTDITLWLSRLAIITARCRTGLDEYYITFETPADWGNHQDIARRFSHWKRRLDLVHKKRFRCTNTEFALRIDAALIDCRDSLFLAESALERVGNRRDSWLHVRINGSPEDVDVFLHGVARRFCLAWCRKKPDTAVLRSEELPTPVVVRLFDGLAAEFKHLTFSVAVSEPELRYQGGCTCQDDYDRF